MCNAKLGLSVGEVDFEYPVGIPEKYKKIYNSEILKRRIIREEEPSDFLAATTQSTRKCFIKLMQFWKRFEGTAFYT